MMSFRMSVMVKLALKSMIMLKYIDFGGHSLLKKSQNQLGSPFPQFRQWVFRLFFLLGYLPLFRFLLKHICSGGLGGAFHMMGRLGISLATKGWHLMALNHNQIMILMLKTASK